MDWRTDFEALDAGVEVLLAVAVGKAETVCLARRHWFPGAAQNEKRLGWQSTFDGSELPSNWRPFAYWIAAVPDPALLEDGY